MSNSAIICPNCRIPTVTATDLGKDAYRCPYCNFVGQPNYKKADTFYAVLSVDQNGNEGIITTEGKIGGVNRVFPLVGTDKKIMQSIITDEFIRDARDSNHDVVLAEFKRVNN